MLPHQFSSFVEGLFGPLHSEFERTPKAASVTTNSPRQHPAKALEPPKRSRGQMPQRPAAHSSRTAAAVELRASTARKSYRVKIRWPYVLAEAFFVVYQLAWTVLFASSGLVLCAIGAGYIAACVIYLGFFYGDHAGKVCFVVDGSRLELPARGGHRRAGGGDGMNKSGCSVLLGSLTGVTAWLIFAEAKSVSPGPIDLHRYSFRRRCPPRSAWLRNSRNSRQDE